MRIPEKFIHLTLDLSLWFKSFFALIEIIGGAIFYFVSQDYIINFVYALTQEELSEDPKDFISHYLISASHNLFSSTQHFIAFYLLGHGIVKLVVIIGLLRNKLWSYPASLAVFSAFIVYQFYRFYFTHSPWLLVLTIFDLAIIWLVWREYSFIKNSRNVNRPRDGSRGTGQPGA